MLYGTGARISEAVGLDVDDLDPVDGTVLLRGKGGKERLVPVGSFAREAVDAVPRARPARAGLHRDRHAGALFLNARGGRLSRQSAWAVLVKAADRAGVTRDVSPHTMRHSFATHLLDGGADVRVVQELLGHASVTTTQVYTLVTVDNLREVFAAAHPRARDMRLDVPNGAAPDEVYDAFTRWVTGQGLELYPHQDEAVIELLGGANVILATPTGSGKSLVALGAHAAALADDRVSFYTAPIKALVSEKFFALCEVFGADNVGMLTGDASVNADAPIICCTAEVLANIALREGSRRRRRAGRHGRVPLLRRARPRLGLAGAAAGAARRRSSC